MSVIGMEQDVDVNGRDGEITEPRTVLIVLASLQRGGAERHGVWLATQIDRAQWRPVVLAFADGPWRAELEQAGVEVRIADLPGGWRSVPASVAVVRSTLAELQPDLVTGNHFRVELALRGALRKLAGSGLRVPYLAWKHTYGHIGYRGLRERLVEKATGGWVTRYGAVCHTQVRYLTDELGLPPQKISVLANSVPSPADLPQPPAPVQPTAPGEFAGPAVLMTAAMRADKDHAAVLRAWPAVRAAVPGAQLRLAGDGPCRPELERLAADLGITDCVRFLGVRGDIDDQLAQASLLVLASYAVECFPYAVLEAMAAGRGVVSTDVAGLPEMVDDGITGRLVPPHDPRALADALIEGLVDNAAAATAWGTAGYLRGREVFGFADWSAAATDLFNDVAAHGGGAADGRRRDSGRKDTTDPAMAGVGATMAGAFATSP